MGAPDKKTVIRELIEQGKAKGQLTTTEILDAIGELDFEPEQLEKFYDTLESQGIELVENSIDDPPSMKSSFWRRMKTGRISTTLSIRTASRLTTL